MTLNEAKELLQELKLPIENNGKTFTAAFIIPVAEKDKSMEIIRTKRNLDSILHLVAKSDDYSVYAINFDGSHIFYHKITDLDIQKE